MIVLIVMDYAIIYSIHFIGDITSYCACQRQRGLKGSKFKIQPCKAEKTLTACLKSKFMLLGFAVQNSGINLFSLISAGFVDGSWTDQHCLERHIHRSLAGNCYYYSNYQKMAEDLHNEKVSILFSRCHR